MRCYALYSNDNTTQYRYIGATTKTLETRLQGHYGDLTNCPRAQWIRKTIAAGGTIGIVELSRHEDIMEMAEAEVAWIELFLSTGHPLLNQRTSQTSDRCFLKSGALYPRLQRSIKEEMQRWQLLNLVPLFVANRCV